MQVRLGSSPLRPLVLVVLAGEFALLAALLVSRVAFPFDNGSYEGVIFAPALLAAKWMNPYAYVFRPPYVMPYYGYVYYLLIGPGIRLFGEHFLFGRLVSVIAAAVCVLQVARITRKVSNSKQAALVAGVTFVSLIPFQQWLAVQRPDMVALAFGLTAIAFVFTSSSPHAAVYGGILASAAILSKQTFVLPVFVIAGYLALQRAQARLLWFLATVGVVVGTVIVALNITSNGSYLWQQRIVVRAAAQSWIPALRVARGLLQSPSSWLCAAVLLLYFAESARRLRSGGRQRAMLLLYLIAAFLLAFLTTRRAGANLYYYLEASAVAAMIIGIACIEWAERWPVLRPEFALAAIAFLSSVYLLRPLHGELFRWRSLGYFRELASALALYVLPDQPAVSVYPELASYAGRGHEFDDIGAYCCAGSEPLGACLNERIRSAPYAAMILHGPLPDGQAYELVPMKTPVPAGVYPAYLYVHLKGQTNVPIDRRAVDAN